jgi:hypothetical protein
MDTYTNVYRIYKSNGKYYIDYKAVSDDAVYNKKDGEPLTAEVFFGLITNTDLIIDDNTDFESTYVLHIPLFGEPYYEYGKERVGEKLVSRKENVSLIDKNTLLIGKSKYIKWTKIK